MGRKLNEIEDLIVRELQLSAEHFRVYDDDLSLIYFRGTINVGSLTEQIVRLLKSSKDIAEDEHNTRA
jgi:hypothetical protein